MRARHEMVLIGQVDSGAEEWFCPSCSRRMLMRWTPEFDTLLLEHGDDTASHFGGKGGLRLNDLEVVQKPAPAEEQWLHSNSIDWDGTPTS